MVFGFDTQESGIACGDTEVTLTGANDDERVFAGSGSIITVDCDGSSCHP